MFKYYSVVASIKLDLTMFDYFTENLMLDIYVARDLIAWYIRINYNLDIPLSNGGLRYWSNNGLYEVK